MAGESATQPQAVKNTTNVHEIIKRFQASKATGKFTYNAGRFDRAINLGVGLFALFTMTQVGKSVHELAYGYGKKDGF